jgi:SAM-dependent methyltransferase
MNTDLQKTYDRIASDWMKDHSSDDWWVPGTDYFLSQLPEGATVLDVGCGAGIKSKYIQGKGYQVTGIDFSSKFIELAQTTSPKSEFQVLPMEEINTLPSVFDAVFAQASLLHIPKNQVADILAKVVEKTVVGGLVYVAVKETKEGQPDEAVRKESDYGYEYERFFSYYSMPELEGYFKNANLSVVWKDSSNYGQTTWLQIIGKRC